MPNLELAEPDFFNVKDALKTFLKAQSVFQDYDFEGSALNILLEILAYNTSFQVFYLNMVASEMFLDSATLRDSVVSRAKQLGYLPISRRSAKAILSVVFTPNDSPSGVTIPQGTKFSTVIDSKTYTFSTSKAYFVERDSEGNYTRDDIEVVEGTRLTHRWVVDVDDVNQKFEIPNTNVDTTTIQVKVQNSVVDAIQQVYKPHEDINVLDGDSRVFFLKESFDGKHEVYFGNGVVGKALADGNVVIVEYVVSNGEEANKASAFEPFEKVGGYNGTVWSVVTNAYGGSEKEDVSEIKFKSPLSYTMQNRAVTATDYELVVNTLISGVDSVRVWGGEDNDPPLYGKVCIAVKTVDGLTLSASLKQQIQNTLISRYNSVAVTPVIVDPDFTYINVSCTVNYRSTLTNDSEAVVKAKVVAAIEAYATANLNKFNKSFRFSQFSKTIDAADTSIQSNQSDILMRYRLFPTLNTKLQYIILFNNAIDTGDVLNGNPTLSSSTFTYNGFDAFFEDDGKGNILIYRVVNGKKITLASDAVGTIDYTTGKIVLTKFAPEALPTGIEYIDLKVTPASNNLSTTRSQILLLESENIEIVMVDEDS